MNTNRFKFRVWDCDEGRFIDLYCGHHNIKLNNLLKDPQLIFQQWTGLKDQDGTDIYEGDIIQLTGAPYKYEIVWDVWHWGIDSHGSVGDYIQGLTSAVYDRAIVIGNIFETLKESSNNISLHQCVFDSDGGGCRICGKTVIENHDAQQEDGFCGFMVCEKCGERAWDGYICHTCGAKKI